MQFSVKSANISVTAYHLYLPLRLHILNIRSALTCSNRIYADGRTESSGVLSVTLLLSHHLGNRVWARSQAFVTLTVLDVARRIRGLTCWRSVTLVSATLTYSTISKLFVYHTSFGFWLQLNFPPWLLMNMWFSFPSLVSLIRAHPDLKHDWMHFDNHRDIIKSKPLNHFFNAKRFVQFCSPYYSYGLVGSIWFHHTQTLFWRPFLDVRKWLNGIVGIILRATSQVP